VCLLCVYRVCVCVCVGQEGKLQIPIPQMVFEHIRANKNKGPVTFKILNQAGYCAGYIVNTKTRLMFDMRSRGDPSLACIVLHICRDAPLSEMTQRGANEGWIRLVRNDEALADQRLRSMRAPAEEDDNRVPVSIWTEASLLASLLSLSLLCLIFFLSCVSSCVSFLCLSLCFPRMYRTSRQLL
jgi:hypothetical protein